VARRPRFVGTASAQLAGRSAEEWIRTLERPTRVVEPQGSRDDYGPEAKAGQVVADIGAGSGIFSLPLARAVKPGGSVYAVDIDKELVDHVTEAPTEQGLTNVQGVVGQATDPNMPDNVDLAFINDVLHHIENRALYLKNLAEYLKPGGRIAVIEFTPDQSPHKADPTLIVSEAQTTGWMTAAGLNSVEKVNLFTDKYFVIYGK
jgi:ubiquinone/menaquinone biosynthesis C-methylase UbiE